MVVVDGMSGLWTHRQTAEFLKITPGTLYVWLSKGAGPKSYKFGRTRRYDPADVREFVRQRAVPATQGSRGHARM